MNVVAGHASNSWHILFVNLGTGTFISNSPSLHAVIGEHARSVLPVGSVDSYSSMAHTVRSAHSLSPTRNNPTLPPPPPPPPPLTEDGLGGGGVLSYCNSRLQEESGEQTASFVVVHPTF